MRNKYRKKIYHYYLKRKYGNNIILGKNTEEIIEDLETMFTIKPVSITEVDYIGKICLDNILGSESSDSIKIFEVIEDSTTALFYKYFRARFVGDLSIYIYCITKEQKLFSNCDLLNCKLQIMKGIDKLDVERRTLVYWHYLDMCHQYNIMQKPYKRC